MIEDIPSPGAIEARAAHLARRQPFLEARHRAIIDIFTSLETPVLLEMLTSARQELFEKTADPDQDRWETAAISLVLQERGELI